MRCPTCKKGVMSPYEDSIVQDGVTFDAMKCSHCGEEIMTMPQLEDLAGKYRRIRDAKKITFAKWGNSLAVRIPQDIAKKFNIAEGREGTLVKEKEGIMIIPSV